MSTQNFRDGLIKASDISLEETPLPIWYGLYPSAVTLLNGQTGIGKSSLVYNIAIHAASNQPLWDMAFSLGRPARVLYLDPENSSARPARLHNLTSRPPESLIFHPSYGIDLSNPSTLGELTNTLIEYEIDLLIIDPIANLFGTNDENDNAEAARQMKNLTDLAHASGSSILCVHHMGKMGTEFNTVSNGVFGRGASARGSAARVVMEFTTNSKARVNDEIGTKIEPRQDHCRLRVLKDGIGVLQGSSLYLRMAGKDQFARISKQDWETDPQATKSGYASKKNESRSVILDTLKEGSWISRQSLLSAGINAKIGQSAMLASIDLLLKSEVIEREEAGHIVRFRIKPKAQLEPEKQETI